MSMLLGIPCPRTLETEYVSALWSWLADSKEMNAKDVFWEPTPNRIDISISKMIQRAKNEGRGLLRLDADVFPDMPLDELLGIVQEGFDGGFDLIGAPILSVYKSLMYYPKSKRYMEVKNLPREGLIECKMVSGGFMAFSPKLIQALPVVAVHNLMTATGIPNEGAGNIYITCPPHTTEDVDTCNRVIALKMKIAMDTRLLFAHGKKIKLRMRWDDDSD